MSAPVPSCPAPSSRLTPWLVLAMLAMVMVPAAITLNTVRLPGALQVSDANPTPYGYTGSLLLFIVPVVVIGFWFLPSEHVKLPRRAFWWTIGVLTPFGCALDFFFASRFFLFRNPGATLRIPAPALGHTVPVEEYIFYFTGFLTILLLYIWLDEYWLSAYQCELHTSAKIISRLLQFHPGSAILGVVLISLAVLYKKEFTANPEGLPWYFIILVVGGMVPSASFYPTARPFVNWRAFSLTMFFILLISLLWEATLGVPYKWWGYQQNEMMGMSIGAWAHLPIEAVCVWIAVTYGSIITFIVIKLWQASEKPARHAFLGVSHDRK